MFFVVYLSTNDLFCPVKQQEREQTRVSINSKVQRIKEVKSRKRKKEKKWKVRAQVIKNDNFTRVKKRSERDKDSKWLRLVNF